MKKIVLQDKLTMIFLSKLGLMESFYINRGCLSSDNSTLKTCLLLHSFSIVVIQSIFLSSLVDELYIIQKDLSHYWSGIIQIDKWPPAQVDHLFSGFPFQATLTSVLWGWIADIVVDVIDPQW